MRTPTSFFDSKSPWHAQRGASTLVTLSAAGILAFTAAVAVVGEKSSSRLSAQKAPETQRAAAAEERVLFRATGKPRPGVSYRATDNEQVQLQMLLQTGIEWAQATLDEDLLHSGQIDHPGETWAWQMPPVQVRLDTQDVFISMSLHDQQGLFNLNNLLNGGVPDEGQMVVYGRLLQLLELPAELAVTLVDHMANGHPLDSIDALASVPGYHPHVLQQLLPHVGVLPDVTPVNINTATAEVLAALVGTDLEFTKGLTEARQLFPYESVDDFLGLIPDAAEQADQMLGVSSGYFLALTSVVSDRTQMQAAALLERSVEGPSDLLWSDFGSGRLDAPGEEKPEERAAEQSLSALSVPTI